MRLRCNIVLAVIALDAVAAGPAGAEWHSFHRQDGLPGNDVNDIAAASDGAIWFACDAGLARSDGLHWERLLDRVFVNAVFEADAGVFWCATDGSGVFRIQGGDIQQFTTGSTNGGLTSNSVTSVGRDASGALWFGTYAHGASRYDGRQWTQLRVPTLPSDRVERILGEASGTLWFGTDRGLSRRGADGLFTTFRMADGLPSDVVQALFLDETGTIWSGTANGVARYVSGRWVTVRSGMDVVSIGREPDGTWWFGTRNGAQRWDGREWLRFDASDGLASSGFVHAVATDVRGNVWFGTNNGASRFDGGRVSWYAAGPPPPPGNQWQDVPLPSNTVTAVLPVHDGPVWFATDAGLARFDSSGWRTSRVAEGLPSDDIRDVVEDATGTVWVATAAGVARVEPGGGFTSFHIADGLPSDDVRDLEPSPGGELWAATGAGAARFAAARWQAVPLALRSPNVRAVALEAGGAVWFATDRGVSRCDGSGACANFTTAEGLASDNVECVFVDSRGAAWAGTHAGANAHEGGAWRTYTQATSGIAGNDVRAVDEDATGAMWFGIEGNDGVSRLQADGSTWRTFLGADGLVSVSVSALAVDARGHVWFATRGGTGVLEPDAAAPTTVLISTPPGLSTSRSQRLTFAAGFADAVGIEFAVSEDDGGTWSPWSTRDFWVAEALPDGVYRWRVRARDPFGSVDPYSPSAVFEIDATPPAPVVSSPGFGDVVRGEVTIRGTTADARFERARVEVRVAQGSTWTPLAILPSPATDAPLATWDTRPWPDGLYELRLTVEDALGLAASVLVGVHADNVAPFADRTTPVRIHAAAGGEAYTRDGALRAYFAPQAFDADAVVTLVPVDTASVSAQLGGAPVLAAYDIAFAGGRLRQPGTLEFTAADARPGLAVWSLEPGGTWTRRGGRASAGSVVVPLHAAARFALAAGGAVPEASASLSAVTLTPAVFSPRGAFAADRVAISFDIGRAGPVSVRLYNRAGRLVRRVVASESMNVGANVVYWDGRDEAGKPVVPGPYLVHVGAPGGERIATVVVTR